ncbi:MAG: CBS domain-containing protein [Phormidesmis sp.]
MAAKLPSSVIAQSCMSSPVRTVTHTATLSAAQQILLRYGHTGLCVIDSAEQLVGMLSRRDVDVAIRHGLEDAAVFTCMSAPVKTISPDTSLLEMRSLMATYDIGRLPVTVAGSLIGIVTRSDLLRQAQRPQQRRQPSATPSVPACDRLYQQLVKRSGAIWPALQQIAEAAEKNGWALYLVGGAVRDLLLSERGQVYPLTDIDLVVDGAIPGAGVALAKTIQSSDPQVDLQVYGEFQTAALTWQIGFESNKEEDTLLPFAIDIATARTEFYPYPAANPEVESSTIHQDLYRRDFTINAMALRLSGEHAGELLDFFGGQSDLQQRQIRVIHPNSFIEDPTRIFRAVRFAVRLDFELEAHTQKLVRYAVHSGLYAHIQIDQKKVPALQSRLKTELEYLLASDRWEQALSQLDNLDALACLHPSMKMTPMRWQQMRRLARWQAKFAPDHPRWLLLLMLLLAQLEPIVGDRVAARLNLDSQNQSQLQQVHQWEPRLVSQLPKAQKPSQIYDCLHRCGLVELLLIASLHPYTLGPQIWHYIVQLSRMPTLINGDTLKRLGYRPSPQFREILAAVHRLSLDGKLDTSAAAQTYVLFHYPLPSNSLST